jgi:hypothetical protein
VDGIQNENGSREQGGGVGGVSRDDVPEVVKNLLGERDREVEVTVRPEIVGGYCSIEWRYLERVREGTRWKPVDGQSEGSAGE